MKEVYSDQELVNGIYIHDPRVIQHLYKKNYRSVLHYIQNHNGNENDAKDVFQDAMIFLHHKIRQQELLLTSSIHTYFFGVAKILWYRSLEKKKRFVFDEQPEMVGENNIIHDLIVLERKKIFATHFKELSEDCQRLINLFIKKTNIGDITTIMGYGSEQFTRNKRLRCKKSLLKKIIENPYFKNNY